MSSIGSAMQRQVQVQVMYTDNYRWLHAWLWRRLGCTHRAADLTQDTFVRVLTLKESVDIHEPRAFLTTVARRVLYNHWRREQIETAYLQALAELPEAVEISPEQQAIFLETLVEIDELLDGLPPDVRKAFLLSQLDGMSHGQISTALGISISTVKRYLIRAGVQCYFAMRMDGK